MNALFGACRALGGVLTQSSIMTAVPARLMGRAQSAFSVIATVLQVIMSYALGWFAQNFKLSIAFLLLGAIYGGAVVAALRVRSLSLRRGKGRSLRRRDNRRSVRFSQRDAEREIPRAEPEASLKRTRSGSMKVFIAGASGVLGRRLVRQFVARGHSVIGQVRSAESRKPP